MAILPTLLHLGDNAGFFSLENHDGSFNKRSLLDSQKKLLYFQIRYSNSHSYEVH
ncbi:MAG: hypothetical protein F6K40_06185 [Okeania sp. SIO3I5]|uniref:hypothetical protein n=1 Tax=Okeania sp. SIO3I5 TaxID=2607805 RepID=UPI0013B6FDC3|nr:hypothetical protein [Okeania sp. SIO3I5]NEQ35897.1 hypothetical protein [Okeania sp. SIO3I5]